MTTSMAPEYDIAPPPMRTPLKLMEAFCHSPLVASYQTIDGHEGEKLIRLEAGGWLHYDVNHDSLRTITDDEAEFLCQPYDVREGDVEIWT